MTQDRLIVEERADGHPVVTLGDFTRRVTRDSMIGGFVFPEEAGLFSEMLELFYSTEGVVFVQFRPKWWRGNGAPYEFPMVAVFTSNAHGNTFVGSIGRPRFDECILGKTGARAWLEQRTAA